MSAHVHEYRPDTRAGWSGHVCRQCGWRIPAGAIQAALDAGAKLAPEAQCDAWHPERRLRCGRALGHGGNHLASFEVWPESAAIHLDDEEGKP